MKSLPRPGKTRAARRPTRNITASMTPAQIANAQAESPASIARTTESWAEQGTPNASSRITIKRSLGVSRIRVVSVAMVSQPRPSTIGRTALPLSPIVLEHAVHHHRQARQVAGVLEQAESDEERADDRQDQRQ